ncbi:hypothetical protein KOR42_50610 [Thalassoglobus neptunius]|uniref:tRNA(Glu)-specific nuclease WapA n=1 Tax=Thalassoglobus neptunius TaxID=1938619 RepID=A0A5C5VPQ3_9PLAN|nr:RHS repeat-associated core domain-containing protein [Thalassoglobus neptunius]TWT39915.1 hypothetical protein KOR42_50610 [Thalassoglobus neptunius]
MQENEYDGLNRRTIRKTYTSGTLSEKRFYFYTEDWQCIEERVADGSTTPGLLPAKEQHVWGNRYIDECVLRDRDYNNNGTTLEERLYATQDANWNTTMLYKQSSGYKERYTYNPYGEITFLNSSFNPVGGSVHNWQHLFGSYKRDTTTELYLVRNRLYHTDLGTWLSRDPIGYSDRSNNLYGYALQNPTNRFDFWGLEVEGYHHGWPLFLGGSNGQPQFYRDKAMHTAAHDYLQGALGHRSGDAARESFRKFSSAQQEDIIRQSMKKAGISDDVINKLWGDISGDANAGKKTSRKNRSHLKIGGPKATKHVDPKTRKPARGPGGRNSTSKCIGKFLGSAAKEAFGKGLGVADPLLSYPSVLGDGERRPHMEEMEHAGVVECKVQRVLSTAGTRSTWTNWALDMLGEPHGDTVSSQMPIGPVETVRMRYEAMDEFANRSFNSRGPVTRGDWTFHGSENYIILSCSPVSCGSTSGTR